MTADIARPLRPRRRRQARSHTGGVKSEVPAQVDHRALVPLGRRAILCRGCERATGLGQVVQHKNSGYFSDVALAPAPELAQVRDWIAALGAGHVQMLGSDHAPSAVIAWYRTHLQTAELRTVHGLQWLNLHCTFCVAPQRPASVLPLLAHANLQIETGRWFRKQHPLRLACNFDVPAAGLDQAAFERVWQRFHDDVLSHGIEITLKTRSDAWVRWLAERGRAPKGLLARRRRKPTRPAPEAP